MKAAVGAQSNGRVHRVLFIQATEPAGYPPLIHASMLIAEAGYEVTFLSAPIADNRFELPRHPRIGLRAIPARPSHVMGRKAYTNYTAAAAVLALWLRPDVVYASDALGAGPGRLAARLAHARLVYHEHDSPVPGALRPWLAHRRAAAARQAELVVFPNEARARIAQAELGIPDERLRIVWNLPRSAELPTRAPTGEDPLVLYYHGSVTPDRLPETLVEAVRRLRKHLILRIAGYEAPGAPNYIAKLVKRGRTPEGGSFVEYTGQVVHRSDLLVEAARAHIGLALIRCGSDDINMRYMAGASNKAFDYMAAGLPLLVSDLTDWRDIFVRPGYARACDPTDPASIAAALAWFIDHPAQRRAMGASGRAKIAAEWNYDLAFQPVMNAVLHA
jgi:glycosyltransferase involved in cell wall biosynthesis